MDLFKKRKLGNTQLRFLKNIYARMERVDKIRQRCYRLREFCSKQVYGCDFCPLEQYECEVTITTGKPIKYWLNSDINDIVNLIMENEGNENDSSNSSN